MLGSISGFAGRAGLATGVLLGVLTAAVPAKAGVVVQSGTYTVTYTGTVTNVEVFGSNPPAIGIGSQVQGSFAFNGLHAEGPFPVVTSPISVTSTFRFLSNLAQTLTASRPSGP